ncbi:MAG TPA: hypothetical protein VGD84_14795, partial [Pseudonocardiaceae bacterium]
MASGADRPPPTQSPIRLVVVLGAALATALLYFFGTGLHPIPWLTWLAPLPVLLLAPRASARIAALAAFTGYFLGGSNIWRYYTIDLQLPPTLTLLAVVGLPLLLTAITLLFRGVLRRGRPLVAATVFPAGIAAAEYLVSIATPAGANWSLAPTQADLLPVLQLASLTGGWGVSFLVSAVPTVLAVLATPTVSTVGRWRTGLAGLVVVGLALGYGAGREHTLDHAAAAPRITLLSARTTHDQVWVDSPAGRNLLS